ncbi:MAG: hypothetical protein JSV54_04955 [Chloroflexota bacterium]|nr:MAG: hypothetical protein JSV54_04955 [Chloroflexota bacterium]
MKTKLLISACILSLVASNGSNMYACSGSPPAPNLQIVPRYVCVGSSVKLDACWSEDPDACPCIDCPTKLCLICESTYLINGIRMYKYDYTNDGVWDKTKVPDSIPDDDPRDYCTYSSAGDYTVKLEVWDHDSCYGLGSDKSAWTTATVTAVEVNNVQYLDPVTGYTDISGTLYVHQGTNVTFKAIPNPSGASWPSANPVWGGEASGKGSTTNVLFNTLSSSTSDYKTVWAECGSSKVTANIIVFDFEGVFTPKDNFDGRHIMYYGIEEEVELDFETDPWSVTAGQAGGLEWTKGSGPGTLSNVDIDYGTADYDAGETDGTVKLVLTIKSGPSKGKWEGYQKDIILPSGTRMTRVNPNNVWHIQYTASAGIKLYYWLDPKYVSFKYLTFGEGSCPSTNVSGFYLTCWPWNSYPTGSQIAGHSQNTFGTISGGNITTGCRVDSPDYSSTGSANPWAAGSYTYVIPSEYIDDTASRHSFGSQTKVGTFDVNGKATNTKGGQPPGEAALNDLTSGY